LTITAAVEGKLVPLPQQKRQNGNPLDLARISSTLKLANSGSFVKSGEPIALIINPNECVVRLNVPEKQVNRVSIGQTVKLLIGQNSPEIALGTVVQIALDSIELGGDGIARPKNESDDYVLVIVKLKHADPSTFYKSKVKAAIVSSSMPMYQYVWQSITDNFEW